MAANSVTGTVIKTTGSWHTVRTDGGQELDCKVKGNFRVKVSQLRATNPVAIGDRVTIDIGDGRQPPFITDIHDRRNYIIRKATNLARQCHILAANVDQALLIVTTQHPATSTTFTDRFLASAEAYDVPVVLFFNKTDLLDDDSRAQQHRLARLYRDVGYTCIEGSAALEQNTDLLKPLLRNRTTLVAGNSGVGKSTLVNLLIPGASLRTAEISAAHDTGQHTTTFSTMLPLPADEYGNGACLIDTPGIKGFGAFDMPPAQISHYFPEIFREAAHCRFSNCTHTREPGCAVLQALQQHTIAESRYSSYLSMMHDHEEDRYRTPY